jgi:hypothetical protein
MNTVSCDGSRHRGGQWRGELTGEEGSEVRASDAWCPVVLSRVWRPTQRRVVA